MLPETRLEDLTWLADTGETFEGAAARIGLTEMALEKWLRNHAPELTTRLINNGRTVGHGARLGKLTVAR